MATKRLSRPVKACYEIATDDLRCVCAATHWFSRKNKCYIVPAKLWERAKAALKGRKK